MSDDADREAAQAGVQALCQPRTMHPCPNTRCDAEYVTQPDADRCGASHRV
jgi:hypothetical protein